MEELDLIRPFIQKELDVDLSHVISIEEARDFLGMHINHLINHHFDQLLQVLYRVDIDEHALRFLLQEHKNEDPGKLIAGMIIERQVLKIKTRRDFPTEPGIPDEEKW